MSRHFPTLPLLPLNQQSIEARVPSSSDPRLATLSRVCADVGNGAPKHGVPEPLASSSSSTSRCTSAVHAPHSTSSTSSASTDWSFFGLSELTVTRALISCPSSGSVIVSPYLALADHKFETSSWNHPHEPAQH